MKVELLRVSVILPVFNDAIRLKKCLEALENQTYPKESYEIIVVDNASTSDIKEVVEQFPQARYAYEGKQGSYAARNKGLDSATGEIIAFTDSDCIPVSNWIESGVNAVQSIPNCGLVGGAITLFFKDPDNPTGVELYEVVLGFPQEEYIEKSKFAATANVFTYREVIDTVGRFDASLFSGGDAEWGRRVHAAGFALHYADNVIVAHPARSTYSEIYKKMVRVINGLPGGVRITQGTSKGKITRQLLRGLVPPFSRVIRVLGMAETACFKHKLKLAAVVVFVSYVWVIQRARIQYKEQRKRV